MSATPADLHARLDGYMDKLNLRSTAQRRTVTDVFFSAGGHLSIEELLQLVRQRDSRIGYATVYRTLKLMKEAGVASERNFGNGVSRYEVHTGDDHHDHLICVECGVILEFEDDQIEILQVELAKRYGFELRRHVHELYGVCTPCQGTRQG